MASGLALMVGIVAAVMAVGGGLGGGDGFYGSLRGEVPGLTAGDALPGDRLEALVSSAQRDDGFDRDEITCPDTTSVTASTAVVCTGMLDGWEWTGIIFFEDSEGSFVVLEL